MAKRNKSKPAEYLDHCNSAKSFSSFGSKSIPKNYKSKQHNNFSNYLKSTVTSASKIIKESRKLLRNVNKTLKADRVNCDRNFNQQMNDKPKINEREVSLNLNIQTGFSMRKMFRMDTGAYSKVVADRSPIRSAKSTNFCKSRVETKPLPIMNNKPCPRAEVKLSLKNKASKMCNNGSAGEYNKTSRNRINMHSAGRIDNNVNSKMMK